MNSLSIILTVMLTAAGVTLPRSQEPVTEVAVIRVASSNGVKAVLEALRPECERAIGRPLAIQFDTSAAQRQKIERGERFDVVIVTPAVIDALIEGGYVAPGPQDIARSGIGIGARSGTDWPGIGTPEAVRQTLLDANSITYAGDGASRPHIVRMLERLGIDEELEPRTILEQGSTRATSRVADGRVDLVITLISEILPVPGIDLLGPLPDTFQSYVGFAAAISSRTDEVDESRALIECVRGPAAADLFRSVGMEPLATD